jgi:hypothetical protein
MEEAERLSRQYIIAIAKHQEVLKFNIAGHIE